MDLPPMKPPSGDATAYADPTARILNGPVRLKANLAFKTLSAVFVSRTGGGRAVHPDLLSSFVRG